MVHNGETSVIKSLKNKGGKSFDTALKFKANYNVIFDFPEKNGKSKENLRFCNKVLAVMILSLLWILVVASPK